MKRAVVVIIIAALVLCMTVTAFAASDFDSGFFLWDLLDGIGGFFLDVINFIGGFIKSAVDMLLSGLKFLFIPSKEFMANFRDDILNRFDDKFGSALSAINYLNGRFGGLKAKSGFGSEFVVIWPRGTFMQGMSIDFLAFIMPALGFIRLVSTGGICYMTAMTIYNKVHDMINV